MPQTDSAKKALRVTARKRVVNDAWRKKLRESLRAVRDALTTKDAKAADKAFVTAQSMIDRATRHHILPKNTAARKKSRLRKMITKLA